jgi:hypothetical protein
MEQKIAEIFVYGNQRVCCVGNRVSVTGLAHVANIMFLSATSHGATLAREVAAGKLVVSK